MNVTPVFEPVMHLCRDRRLLPRTKQQRFMAVFGGQYYFTLNADNCFEELGVMVIQAGFVGIKRHETEQCAVVLE